MANLTPTQNKMFEERLKEFCEGNPIVIEPHEIPDEDGRTVAVTTNDGLVSVLGMCSASRFPVWRHIEDDKEAALFMVTHNLVKGAA